ncbi:hypothetical protein LCGC14_2998300, partial [marine sediment metagenome]
FCIATERGGFTFLPKHVRHERLRCLARSTPHCVVIEILSGDEP